MPASAPAGTRTTDSAPLAEFRLTTAQAWGHLTAWAPVMFFYLWVPSALFWFRWPWTAVLAAALAAVLALVLPAVFLVRYARRLHVVVDADGVTESAAGSTTHHPWDQLATVEVRRRLGYRSVRLWRVDGRGVALSAPRSWRFGPDPEFDAKVALLQAELASRAGSTVPPTPVRRRWRPGPLAIMAAGCLIWVGYLAWLGHRAQPWRPTTEAAPDACQVAVHPLVNQARIDPGFPRHSSSPVRSEVACQWRGDRPAGGSWLRIEYQVRHRTTVDAPHRHAAAALADHRRHAETTHRTIHNAPDHLGDEGFVAVGSGFGATIDIHVRRDNVLMRLVWSPPGARTPPAHRIDEAVEVATRAAAAL